jgi:hypothetical protein
LVFGTTKDLAESAIVRRESARVAKIKIPGGARYTLKKELDYCGVNFSLVYPDLEGLALHILWRWKRTNRASIGTRRT